MPMLEAELLDYLREYLPDHMIPTAVVELDALPQTPNHKVDVKALPAPKVAASSASAEQEPGDDVERELARFWAELLRREAVGRHENVFRLGGNSLLVMRVIAHVRKRYGVAVSARQVFEHPTVAALARQVRAAGGG